MMMPQASDELRALWGGKDGVGDDKAIAHLESKGWKQVENGLWRMPTYETWHSLPMEDKKALQFLIDEWDHDLSHTPRRQLREVVESPPHYQTTKGYQA